MESVSESFHYTGVYPLTTLQVNRLLKDLSNVNKGLGVDLLPVSSLESLGFSGLLFSLEFWSLPTSKPYYS